MGLSFRKAKYFDGKLSHGLVSLLTSSVITNIAGGFFGVFLPIFLYKLFEENITLVILYYLASQVLYLIFLPLGARILNKFGFRHSLQLSTVCGALYYLGLRMLKEDTIHYVVPFLIIIITIWRILYWVPYHVDFAKFSGKNNKGKTVGFIQSIFSLIGVIAPLIAGWIIVKFGYDALFVAGIVIYLASMIPYITIPRTKEKFSWGYFETWRKLFKKKHVGTTLAFMADGAESVAGVIIWPIFIFIILDGDFMKVGSVSSAVVLITMIMQLLMGKYADKKPKKSLLKIGTVLYALIWIGKTFILTFFHIFLADMFHKFSKIFLRIPFDAATYEIAADQGHYVDEFTVLHEMAIAMGRTLMYSSIIILVTFVPLKWVFILAAMASLTFNMIYFKDNGKKA